jgi:5-methylcytosine-specific restriction endonuclease McrA
MGATPQPVIRCVHCLRETDATTKDHVFPSSWYPDSTPETVQRWTVPSCTDCNTFLGKLETDLLVRLALCLEPASASAAGISSKALRSLGLDVDDLNAADNATHQACTMSLPGGATRDGASTLGYTRNVVSRTKRGTARSNV